MKTDGIQSEAVTAEALLRTIREHLDAYEAGRTPNGHHSGGSVLRTEAPDNDAACSIGERLRRVRGTRSRRAFAEAIDVSPNSLFRYESGERSLDAQTILTICRVYDVDPAWLLTGSGNAPSEQRGAS